MSRWFYRVTVLGSILGGAVVGLCTRNVWWTYGGLTFGLALLAIMSEPEPAGEGRHADHEPDEPEPAGGIAMWLERSLPDLATALKQLEVTDVDGTELAGLPTPMHPEATRYWLEDLADYLEHKGMTTHDLAEQLGELRAG